MPAGSMLRSALKQSPSKYAMQKPTARPEDQMASIPQGEMGSVRPVARPTPEQMQQMMQQYSQMQSEQQAPSPSAQGMQRLPGAMGGVSAYPTLGFHNLPGDMSGVQQPMPGQPMPAQGQLNVDGQPQPMPLPMGGRPIPQGNPGMGLQRLSPGVYRDASGQFVNSQGQPLRR